MKFIFNKVLLFLSLQWVTANILQNQKIYSFYTNVTVLNNASTDISQWSLYGELKLQSYNDYIVMQLRNLSTTAYNGPYNSKYRSKTEIPSEEIYILTKPFIAYYKNNKETLNFINFASEEPLWSLNIKKAIASIYQIDTKLIQNSSSEEKTENNNKQKRIEQNIFGKCTVHYKVPNEEKSISLVKEIDYNECELESMPQHWWKKESFGHLSGTSMREYKFSENSNDANNFLITDIISNSVIKYRVLMADRIVHEIHQMQIFKLLSTSPVDQEIDLSKYTLKKTPQYEFYKYDIYSNIKSQETLTKKCLSHFVDFIKLLDQNSLTYINDNTFNVIDKLFSGISNLNLEKVNLFDDQQIKHIFMSMLPYIGSQNSVQFLSGLIFNETLDEMSQIKLLATFPVMVDKLDDATVKKMENLLEVKNNLTRSVTQTYILSFSNLIAKLNKENADHANRQNDIKKYVNKYFKLFSESKDYDTRMNYLLGLMNMGELAKKSLMSVVLNTSESYRMRSLATYAVKPLIKSKKTEVFKSFWPLVTNTTEPFDLRVAALHLLLESDIESKDLYEMLNYMNQLPNDPIHQHLHNYFYTSMQSGRDDCDNCTMKQYSKKILSELKPPVSFKGLMTGNYHISYSDSEKNFECSIDTHLVANPVTNFINVYKISFKKSINLQDTDYFAIYLRAEGVSSRLFDGMPDYERPIEELFKILMKSKLKLKKEEDLHIELIVYHEGKAIIGFFINENNFDDIEYFITELLQYIANNEILFMKETGRLEFVSDLGTPILAEVKQEYTLSTRVLNAESIFLCNDDEDDSCISGKFKSIWNLKQNFQTYNPITDISHGVSKIHSTQVFLNLKLFYNLNEFYIKWNDDESYFDFLIDYKHAVYVDKPDVLKKYCTTCNSVDFYKPTEKTEINLDLWLWVKRLHIKDVNCKNIEFLKTSLPEIMNKSHMTYIGYPLAQPLIIVMYIVDYLYTLPPSDICSISIKTNPVLDEPNMSMLQLSFINDPIDENSQINVNFNISLVLTQTGVSDEKTLLNQWNVYIQRQELSYGDLYDVMYDNIGKSLRMELTSKIDFNPSVPNIDMFSLKAAEPIFSNTVIHYEEENIISTDIEIETLFSITDERKYNIYKSENCKVCHEQSTNLTNHLKHTPPTKECYITSLDISTYDHYEFNLKFQNASGKLMQFLDFHLLKPLVKKAIDNENFNVSIAYLAETANMNILVDEHNFSNYTVPRMFRPRALLKSKTKLIEDITFATYGFESICIITPTYIKTFTEDKLKYDSSNKIINLIECSNITQIGLVSKLENNRISLKLWTGGNIFRIYSKDKDSTCYVKLNNKPIKKNMQTEDFSVEFFNNNMFRLKTNKFDVIYNEDYVMVKMKSALANQFCGVCTGEKLNDAYIH